MEKDYKSCLFYIFLYVICIKFCIVLLLIIGSTTLVKSQSNKTDSLLHLLQKEDGNKKVDILNEISISYRINSLNNSLDYAKKALAFAQKNDYIFGQAEAYKNIGVVFFMQNKPQEALVEYNKSLDLFRVDKNAYKIAAMLNNIGIIYVAQGDYQLALNNFNEAVIVNQKERKPEAVANIYNNIGMVYSKWGIYDKSQDYYQKSLEINRELNNKLGVAAALNNLALIQKTFGKYDKAIEYYQEAIKVNEEIEDKSGIARCFGNMANVYISLGDTLKAIELNTQSLELKMELNDEQGIVLSYLSIGELQRQMGENDKAIHSYKKSLEISKITNDKENMMDSYSALGNTFLQMNKTNDAFEYFTLALEIANELNSKNSIAFIRNKIGKCLAKTHQYNSARQNLLYSLNLANELDIKPLIERNYLDLTEVSKQMKNFEEAYEYQNEYIKIHQTIFNEASQAKIAQLEANYENEKKEKEIVELKIKQEKINQRNQLIIILAVVLIFFISFIFLLNKNLTKRRSIKLLDQKNTLLKKTNIELVAAKEKAEESDKLKTAFLTSISHEIRTPMNAIIGFSEFLADNSISEIERIEFFQIVKLNSEMLLGLIDDILDVSLIETGQLRIRTEKVSLNKIMDETYQLFKENEKLKLSHIDFTYFVHDIQKDIFILSDSFRLKQILSNLIDNAIKFTDSGQVSFTYKIIEIDNRNFIKFQVDDSGIGIDNKYQNRIFERFFRITTDNNHLYKGSGVGLSIVKSLVDIMGGEIWYSSAPNSGSTFFFTVPFIESKNEFS
ncbi:MAG: hypothetical protein A2W99_04635 [Bacteroidetes bacterium GWF2_33_16]|nr:MAG: hypothetical protein A2X00_17155 [Bacteroidetes bacterium GWE2_32_14]OFY05955.1 MAG: hypothetical protein A2W99_04635 [Bacteroidetes bacterium GWF2_33_16]